MRVESKTKNREVMPHTHKIKKSQTNIFGFENEKCRSYLVSSHSQWENKFEQLFLLFLSCSPVTMSIDQGNNIHYIHHWFTGLIDVTNTIMLSTKNLA